MTASIAMTACSKQAVPTAIPEDAKIEQQVEELLSKMDLDAKIGQMTELAIDVLGETINAVSYTHLDVYKRQFRAQIQIVVFT